MAEAPGNDVRMNLTTIIRKYLKTRGKVVCSEKQYDTMEKFIMSLLAADVTAGCDVSSILFSKDRALQLHAFLGSYVDNVSNRGTMHVLFKASTKRHEQSYDELKVMFSGENVIFHAETDFRSQLVGLCEDSPAGKIMFYVDDMIFTHQLDYDAVRLVDSSRYILSLTRGKDLTYSLVYQKPLSLPAFYDKVHGFECFRWDETEEFSDWSFPLGVSGYLFGRQETLAMLKTIEFRAPNSLEAGLQNFLPFFRGRFGLCTDRAVCTCVPANLVQSEWSNLHLGTFTVDELLSVWEQGNMIDRREFYGKPMDVTQTQRYTFIDRR